MQTNDDLKIIVEDIALEAFKNDWDRSQIRTRIEHKIVNDENRAWAMEKVVFKCNRMTEIQQFKKSGKGKIGLGIFLIIVGFMIPSIYSFFVISARSVVVVCVPIILGLYLIHQGRNDLNRY